MADSRDSYGHYCGQDAKTGRYTESPDMVVGFCGPECEHCSTFKVYAIQNNVWVCAADYDYEED